MDPVYFFPCSDAHIISIAILTVELGKSLALGNRSESDEGHSVTPQFGGGSRAGDTQYLLIMSGRSGGINLVHAAP